MQENMTSQFNTGSQSGSQFAGFGGATPQSSPQSAGFGSATPQIEKEKKVTSLTKEQALAVLAAVFGCLALVFLVSTIAIAVNKPTTTAEGANRTPQSVASMGLLTYDTDKIENRIEGETYKMGQIIRNVDGHQVIAVFANDDGNGISFEVNWEFANSYYDVNSSRVDQEVFKITMGEESVADLMVGRASDDPRDDVLLILLANGTVQYMPIRQSLEKYSFKVAGEIAGAANVAKFYRVYETVNDELVGTIMAQQIDGKIIDLRQQLLKIVGKDIK